jgi:hypothetical protein
MDGVRSLTDQLSESTNEFWATVGDYLPKLFGALVLLVVALIVAKLAQWVVEKVLDVVGVNRITKNKNIARSLQTAEINVDLVSVTGRVAFWVVIIIFALTIADVLELTAMRDVINAILGYLPNVLAAVIVLTVTVAGARLVRDVVGAALRRMRVDYSSQVAAVAYYVLVVFGVLMAVEQLGFATTILAANLTIIVAGIVLALSLAFGLGGREVAGRMVEDAYSHFKRTGARKR